MNRRRRTAIAASALSLVTMLGVTVLGTIPGLGGSPAGAADQHRPPAGYRNPALPANAAVPAVLRAQDGFYYLYTSTTTVGADTRTQHLLPIWRSTDLTDWRYVGDALTQRPAWATDDQLWAPDVHYFDGRYHLYFTVAHAKALPAYGSPASTAAAGVAAIGVATAPTPTGPWTEAGPPAGAAFPHGPIVPPSYGWCLDAANPACYNWHFDSYVYQGPDGTRYLYEGSYFQGNRLWTLAPDGLSTVSGPVQFGHNIRYEASYLVPHVVNGVRYYYLLNSQSDCCAGPDSPYSVVANRSTQPQGGFADQHGSPMEWAYGPPADPATLHNPWDNPIWWNLAGEAGGYPVLRQNGNGVVGPGGQAVITDLSGRDWLLYHGIEQRDPALSSGDPLRQLYLDPLDWTADGWPDVNDGNGPSRGGPAPVTRPLVGDTFNDRRSLVEWLPRGGSWTAGQDQVSGGFVRQTAVAGAALLAGRRPVRTGAAGYRVECDLRSTGATGQYGCATSIRSDGRLTATIDLTGRTLRLTGGTASQVSSAPLPATFKAGEWAHLVVVADGTTVTATLQNSDRNPLIDVSVAAPAIEGGIGFVTDGATADFDNLSAATRDVHVAVPATPPATGTVVTGSSDGFDNTLGGQWHWLREDPALHGFAPTGALALTSNGNLDEYQRMSVGGGQLPWTRNVLLQAAPSGDWMVETRLHFDPQTANLSAGIMAYSDDDTNVANTLAWNGNLTQVATIRNELDPVVSCPLTGPSDGANVAVTTYGPRACPPTSEHTSQEAPARLGCCWNGNGQAGADDDPSHITVYLRIYRHGDTYTPWYSYDGQTWDRENAWTLRAAAPQFPIQIGLFASDNNQTAAHGAQAWFDYVHVYSSEEHPR